jgi:hypothetical protein
MMRSVTDPIDVFDIPELLHDATLVDVAWDRATREVRMTFRCLRRAADGSSLEDRHVELVFTGTAAIAAYEYPAHLNQRPSELPPQKLWAGEDLARWLVKPREADLWLSSRARRAVMHAAPRIEWLYGSDVEAPLSADVVLSPFNYSPGFVTRMLHVEFEEVIARSEGQPLALATWAGQYEAWWRGWSEYWALKSGDSSKAAVEEETAIPAAPSRPVAVEYQPPGWTAIDAELGDMPAELFAPIRDLVQGRLQRDWVRVARAERDLDRPIEEQAKELESSFFSDGARWLYVRRIESWWIEGALGCVVVRGIEHAAPDPEEPREDLETVVTYSLIRTGDGWIIHSFSQGWPKYDSAPP